MAKINVLAKAVVVTSTLKIEEIKLVKKYRPEALTLFEGEGDKKEPVFCIGLTRGAGEINQYGASFSENTPGDGKEAQVTMILPDGISDVKEYVSDAIGRAVIKLNKLEATVPGIIEEIKAEKAEIEANITIG